MEEVRELTSFSVMHLMNSLRRKENEQKGLEKKIKKTTKTLKHLLLSPIKTENVKELYHYYASHERRF